MTETNRPVWASALGVTLSVVTSVAACAPTRRDGRAVDARANADAAPPASARPASNAPDGGAPREVPAVFALVAAADPRLVKLVTGDVLGVVYGGSIVRMQRNGSVTREMGLSRALSSVRADIGEVGGTWPGTLFVERRTFGAAPFQGKDNATFVFQGDDAHPRSARLVPGAYYEPPQPWKGGVLLTLRVGGFSGVIDSPSFDRAATFEAVAPQTGALPRFPKDGLYDAGFAAYPGGRVFALGSRRSRPVREDASEYEHEHRYNLDGALVWQTDDRGANLEAVQLPGTKPRDRFYGRIARGRDESEALVWGRLDVDGTESETYLARFGPTGWARVAAGDEPFVALDIGRDGSIWTIRGKDARTGSTTLMRAAWVPNGGLRFEPVVVAPTAAWRTLATEPWMGLDACRIVRPRSLAVVDAEDVWISGDCAGSANGDLGSGVLLHTQAQRPLVTVDMDEPAK